MFNIRKLYTILAALIFISLAADVSAQSYVPGEVYYGRNNYTAYYAGELPLIFSAGHGGFLTPDEIPDRTYGTTVTDSRTIETAMAIRAAVHDFTGKYPHLIISRLKRTKLDPNREIGEAAQGNQWAEQAWYEYHGFIDSAKDTVTKYYGRGFYVDVHGHGHSIKRLELGYLISSSMLFLTDSQLNTQTYINMSSIRDLAGESPDSFAELLRGSESLGTLFEDRGIPAVPSTNQPDPGSGNPYFSGGYSTYRHGSRDGGTISGVQLEAHYTGIRNSSSNRENFAEAFTEVLDIYFREHFGWDGLVSDVSEITSIPHEFNLRQNYPNPFNMSTKIEFTVPHAGAVTINIFDINGRKTAVLMDQFMERGNHTFSWNAANNKDLSSGIYFCELTFSGSKNYRAVRKLTLVK